MQTSELKNTQKHIDIDESVSYLELDLVLVVVVLWRVDSWCYCSLCVK